MSSPTALGIGEPQRQESEEGRTADRSRSKPEITRPRRASTVRIATARGPVAAGRPCLLPGGVGDHPAIHRFLLSVFQAPSAGEFQSQLEDPAYEPSDRLLIKDGQQIVGHVRLTKREMHFGPLQLPITVLSDLAVLPEYHSQGWATALLAVAERQMGRNQSVLGILRTRIPQFFQRSGWAVCMRHSYSTAGAREILSHLSAVQAARSPAMSSLVARKPGKPLNIRLWRHVEKAALVRLYEENAAKSFGPLYRSEAYWLWLIGRRGYDRIYVAIDGPDKLELDEALAPIVGYAVMKEGRIVEIMTSQRRTEAGAQLLARASGDAIERDCRPVCLEAPPSEPLHELLVKAGGERRYHEAVNGEVFLVKLFDPLRFLSLLRPQLHERANASGLPRPSELGLRLRRGKQRLVLSRNGVAIKPGKLGRSYLICSDAELTRLLLGHLNVHEALRTGRVAASTRIAAATAAALFPQLPLWRPAFDELPA